MTGRHSAGVRGGGTVDAALREALLAAAQQGRIACPAALAVADRLGRSPREVGRACDSLGLKIIACQLGCFGRPGKPEDEA